MALTDFKLIHPADTSITSIADIATNGMVAGNVAKAADVNAIFKQNSLIGVGLLTGLNALGNTNNTSTPNDTDLTKITTYFSNALSLIQPTLANNVLTIGLGAQIKTIDLSSVVVANATEATHATSADTALMANAASSAMNAGTASVAQTLGTVDVGSESQAIYLDEGTPKTANIFENSNNICVCQTLVKNMNGATVSGVYFNNYSYQGYTVKQLQDGNGNPITSLDTIKNYLKQMTGHKRVPIYDQFTPLNEYLFCSDDNLIWKLQYGSSTGLLAFRVDNLPYFAQMPYRLYYKSGGQQLDEGDTIILYDNLNNYFYLEIYYHFYSTYSGAGTIYGCNKVEIHSNMNISIDAASCYDGTKAIYGACLSKVANNQLDMDGSFISILSNSINTYGCQFYIDKILGYKGTEKVLPEVVEL